MPAATSWPASRQAPRCPESASIRADGNVYFTGFDPSGNGVYLLNTSTGATSLFASAPSPDMTKIAATGGVWVGDYFDGAQRFDDSGNFLQRSATTARSRPRTIRPRRRPTSGMSNFAYWDLFQFDQIGNQQLGDVRPGALGLTVWGVDNPNAPPQDTQDYYSFALTGGQSTTIVAKSLNGKNVQITLVDGSGNVLATGVGGSSNVTPRSRTTSPRSTGTYYVEVTGDPGVQYSLTVTRNANFDIEPHDTITTAQSVTGTDGVLGALDPGGTLVVGTSFEGVDFIRLNNCGCLPPDTNAAVGPNYVVETVNLEIRIFDKTTGSILLDEPLATFFGASTGGDPYVVYDDIANRWYVSVFDSADSGLFLAVSKDCQPARRLPADLRPHQCGRLPRLRQDGLQQGRHLHRLQRLRQRRRAADDRRRSTRRRPSAAR